MSWAQWFWFGTNVAASIALCCGVFFLVRGVRSLQQWERLLREWQSSLVARERLLDREEP